MKPSELLEDNSRLVAHLDTLPFQEGRPLSQIHKEGTMLVNYTSDEHTLHRHVFMTEEGERNQYTNELLEQIFEDQLTANAGVEDETQRVARRLKNQRRDKRRRNAADRQRRIQRNLTAEFAAAGEEGFHALIANIAFVATLLANTQDPTTQKALLLT
jgi:serine phosphatase RsbU (regulator of sigma subunit)